MKEKSSIEKLSKYDVGDVIYAQGLNMGYDYRRPISEENRQVSMFIYVVLYAEHNDRDTIHNNNYLVAKLTTSMVDEQVYSVRFRQSDEPNLLKDGYVSVSKVQTLTGSQIVGRITKLSSKTMTRIIKSYIRFQNENQRQMLEKI